MDGDPGLRLNCVLQSGWSDSIVAGGRKHFAPLNLDHVERGRFRPYDYCEPLNRNVAVFGGFEELE